jgi:hypothetical protein
MKQFILGFLSIAFLVSMTACSKGDEPQFRILNQRLDKANVQIQTSGGNTININDVQYGQTTAYQSTSEGTIVVTAVIQNESVSPTATFSAAKDTRSTIIIQTGNPPSISVDQTN